MANSNKNIVITPNISNTADPKIVFSGGNTTVNTDISMFVYPNSNGTLSFEGSAGQLFSITNDLSGSIFSVNDVSGIPSLEVFANGQINLAPYGGNVVFGNNSPITAPIYYDSGNTSFYANPAGVSIFANLQIGSTTAKSYGSLQVTGISNADRADANTMNIFAGTLDTAFDASLYVSADSNNDWGIWLQKASWEYGIRYNLSATHTYGIVGQKAGTEYFRVGVDQLYHWSNIRAPIFYDRDDTGFYLDPASTTTSLQIAGAIEHGNNFAHPNIEWSASGASTGMVIFSLPGAAANYGMVHMVFDVYEYTGAKISTVIVGGHNWSSAWYNPSCQVIGNFDKTVRLGFKDGKYCVVFGGAASTWDYGTIRLRKIHNGSYYNGIIDLGGAYTVAQTTTESFTVVSADLRYLRTSGTFQADADVRAPIFYDLNNTAFYIDPASGSSIKRLFVDTTNVDPSEVNGAALGNINEPTTGWSAPGIAFGSGAGSHGAIGYGSGIMYFASENGSDNTLNSRMTLTSGGVLSVTTDVRAPIFYDTNNTAYYTDPASTSNLNGLTVAGTITGSIQYVTVGMAPNADNYMNFRVMRNNNSTTSNDGMYIGYINTNSGVTRIFGGGASTGEMTKYSDRTEEPGSFRAPVFYDVNNTGFYVDPASLSNINSLAFKGRLAFQTADTSENGLMNLSYLLFKSGNKLYTDEDFNRGTNGISVYNNLGGSALTVARTADATAPNSSRQVLRFTYNGGSNGTSPGLGGFFFGVSCTANRILVCTFKAKLPLNYNFEWASNATGTNSNVFWLTSNTGTGKYEEYAYAVMCGNTGSFSTTHFFYVNGTAPANGTVLFDIASATVWDITDNNQTNTESVRAANDMRAPIFYDSDNTAYYLDPANATTSAILNGKVGIGNTTPAHTLRVQGDISLSGGVHANGSLGTSGHILTTNGTGSYWAAANVANVTGVLPINNGGTNSTATPTQYGIAYGTGTAYAFTAQSSIGQFLYGLGSVNPPVWVTLDLDFMPEAWVKKTVRVATTANITLSGTQTVDGVALVSGDRILVKNQTTASQNGIYIVLAGAWSRQDTQTNIPGAIVTVSAGTVNAGRTYRTDFKATDTFNSTAMNWYQVLDEATGATRSRAIAMSMLFG